MMTQKAHELGMAHTNFHNASGLPDLQQLTTARDMAVLARHLAYDFPQYYHYFSAPGFSYGNRSYATHDNLLAAFGGTDGIKTGYTQLSGFNLVTSVVRNDKHVIGVVLGGPTAAVRDREMMRLLSAAFEAAKSDPDMLAEIDVPWKGGKMPGPDLFKAIQGEDNPLLLAALEPKSKAKSTAKIPPVLVADAKKVPGAGSGLTVVPISKPASETYPETAAPVLSHETVLARETDVIEAPLGKVRTPLQFDPASAQQIADASVPLAQGDGGTDADATELPNPAPVIAWAANPVPAKTLHAVPMPAAPVLANLTSSSSTLASNATVKRWAVQIGAFASETLARAKLAVFARSGFDVIGQAQKLVIPFTSGGRIMYRARLGMFAEGQARDICKRMEQRGQSCFVAAADAG
jgi:D-alanyl-D-alanine carboxypeptidase